MQEESAIFGQDTVVDVVEQDDCEVKLLKTTANARLYRVSRRGKHFLKKTTKDNSERQLQQLRREYELSIGCDHPHIVHIFIYEPESEVGEGILMEYIEGRTLAEYIAENPAKKERERLFEELLSAVGYLHKRGIIHNDLKPENILISRADNSLKLIDFGLADSDAHYALKTLGCTPRYASPELRRQSKNIDARSDIYSIGIIMRELLGESAISRRCTKQNPDERYSNIEALQRAWCNRHRPYHAIVAAILLILFLLPTALYTQTKIEESKKGQKQELLLSQMERDITEICERAKDSVRNSRYIEFSTLHIDLMREACSDYMQQLYNSVDNTDLEAILATRFGQIYEKQWLEAVNMNVELRLPTYHLETSMEQWRFYDSLMDNRLPYRPYRGK